MTWSRFLYGLTFAVTVAGFSALALQLNDAGAIGRAPTLDAWWHDVTREPLLGWLAASGALAAILAWVLDRWAWGWGFRSRSQQDEPRIEVSREVPRLVAARAEQPVARTDDLRRLKLEAFLRGRPNADAFVDHLLDAAQAAAASDVHLQISESEGQVTFRTGGELCTVARYARDRHDNVARRLKVMAGLPPYIADTPQDGSFTHGDLDVRLSTVPSREGERIALRLAGDASLRPLDQLGFEVDDLERWRRLLSSPQGMIVLTGPAGSGKTTTLYSALHHIHNQRGDRTAISSIEDPIEVALPFIHQVAVDRARGVAFASALRSVLRQDPNVLMVGEIRDTETARVAIQAGLSGHLILTTLHADSALGVFPRLIDLGAEPFLAASATVAAVAQRLVPRLCPACRHPKTLDRASRSLIQQRFGDQALEKFDGQFHVAPGCDRCHRKGTEGRQAIFEIVDVDPALRRLVASNASMEDVRRAAAQPPNTWMPLAESAVGLAALGKISLDQALALNPNSVAN